MFVAGLFTVAGVQGQPRWMDGRRGGGLHSATDETEIPPSTTTQVALEGIRLRRRGANQTETDKWQVISLTRGRPGRRNNRTETVSDAEIILMIARRKGGRWVKGRGGEF